MPTPLATQAPDDLGLKATLQWERPCGDMGLDTALEGKEPGCGSGWRDRPGTEGTTVGQPTQGTEWCFIGLGAAGYPARVEPGVGPTRETAFCHILLFNASICATEGEQ